MRTPSIVVSVVVLACLTNVVGVAQRKGPEGFLREGILKRREGYSTDEPIGP